MFWCRLAWMLCLAVILAGCGSPAGPSPTFSPVEMAQRSPVGGTPTGLPSADSPLPTPTSQPAPTSTFTPLPSPTPTATPTPGPPFFPLVGRVAYVSRHGLYSVALDGSDRRRLKGREIYEPPTTCFWTADVARSPSGKLLYAGREDFTTDVFRLEQVPLPEDCFEPVEEDTLFFCSDVGCRCFDFLFSPDGRKLAYTYLRDRSSTRIRVVDLATGQVDEIVSCGPSRWLPDGRLVTTCGHCEGAAFSVWDLETGEGQHLQMGEGLWNAAGMAFVSVVQPYMGTSYLWGYDFVHESALRSVAEGDFVMSVFWVPEEEGYVYTRAELESEMGYDEVVPIGPREVWRADALGQNHRCLACDPAYNYDALGWVDGNFLVRELAFTGEEDTQLYFEQLCRQYDCSEARYFFMDVESGALTPATVTSAPDPYLRPDPHAEAVYTEPDGAWSLVPGRARGLWRIYADGRPPEIVVEEGLRFVWVPEGF